MSTERKPAMESFDALVDLASSENHGAYSYLLAKHTYDISEGVCVLTEPEPLFHDIRDEELQPRLVAGTDYWDKKLVSDFVVQGSAFAPDGKPLSRMRVVVQVENYVKRLDVIGKRTIDWKSNGKPSFSEAEPFTEMPLTYENAYGGIDWRTPVDDRGNPAVELLLGFDHPGMYPRNPFGKGYLVQRDPVEGVELPNLEDPDELLTEDKIIVSDPRRWYLQPLPWCLDWVHPVTFPRNVLFAHGVDAWHPAPEDEQLAEVARGYISSGFRSAMRKRRLEAGPDPLFYQEASTGMIFDDLHGGERVVIRGMHPEDQRIELELPSTLPVLEIEIEGSRERVETNLHSVVVRPAEKKLYILVGGWRELTRMFVPGIHKEIPVTGFVNGEGPIRLETPLPFKESLGKPQSGKEEA